MSADENIRVVARFRPPSAREAGSAQKFRFGHDGRSVSLSGDDATAFALDQVLPPEATQDDTYQHVSAIVEAVLQGYNGTILAYGQTGSGKTHSVTGSSADPGLLPRAVARIFEHVCDDTSGACVRITCFARALLFHQHATERCRLNRASVPFSQDLSSSSPAPTWRSTRRSCGTSCSHTEPARKPGASRFAKDPASRARAYLWRGCHRCTSQVRQMYWSALSVATPTGSSGPP